MTIAYLNKFTESVIGGRGYIAVSVVIFARFLPSRAALGALIFGFFTALQLRMQALGVNIPSQLLLALPYVATIVALILASKNASMLQRLHDSLFEDGTMRKDFSRSFWVYFCQPVDSFRKIPCRHLRECCLANGSCSIGTCQGLCGNQS